MKSLYYLEFFFSIFSSVTNLDTILPYLYRNDNNNKERALDVVPFSTEKKTDGTLALVKPGQDKIKSTPAGEYLTSALNDFDLEQYDGLAAISDGANKLLMLV